MERVKQVLGIYLRHFIACQQDWVTLLPWAEFSYNNHSESSPFIIFGQHQCLPLPLAIPFDLSVANSRIHYLHYILKQYLQQAVPRFKSQVNKRWRVFQPGDKVLLSFKYICLKIPCFKLAPLYLGPFFIILQ